MGEILLDERDNARKFFWMKERQRGFCIAVPFCVAVQPLPQ
jgi:hypothetical protein